MFPEGRIFDFLIVGIVALIVVGPKDLPLLMRKVGQFVARMRAMAAEFRASFDEMARHSELEELRREVDAMRAAHTGDLAKATALADPEVQQVFDDIHAGLRGGQVQLGPQMTPLAAPAAPTGEPVAPAEAAETVQSPPPKKTRTRARRKTAAEASS